MRIPFAKLRLVTLFIFLLAARGMNAQDRELFTGIVADETTFESLPYASIQIKGTLQGTYTDEKGKFSIVAGRKDTLQISLIGYETLEQPLRDYEASVIMLKEKVVMLKPIIVNAPYSINYRELFDDQIKQDEEAIKHTPFYYTHEKKEKIKTANFLRADERARTYVSVVLNPDIKTNLQKKFHLTDEQFYAILQQFNEQHYEYMYYLSAPELLSMLNRFFDSHAPPTGDSADQKPAN